MRNLSEKAKQHQYETQRRIHKATLESITVWIKKGERQKYKDLAIKKGMSLNSLIVNLLNEALAE